MIVLYFFVQTEDFIDDKRFAKPKEEITSDSIYEVAGLPSSTD